MNGRSQRGCHAKDEGQLQCYAAFENSQFPEIVALVAGLLAIGELNDRIDKLAQQLRHRFTVDQLSGVKIDPVFFLAANSLLVAIFTVGTKPPYGVPRPVLNSTI